MRYLKHVDSDLAPCCVCLDIHSPFPFFLLFLSCYREDGTDGWTETFFSL